MVILYHIEIHYHITYHVVIPKMSLATYPNESAETPAGYEVEVTLEELPGSDLGSRRGDVAAVCFSFTFTKKARKENRVPGIYTVYIYIFVFAFF